MRMILSFVLCLTVLGGAAGGCSRKTDEPGPRKVQRQTSVISAASGEVFFRAARGSNWHPASSGFALVSGDAVSTAGRSRTEIQTRMPAAQIRMDGHAVFVLEQADSAGLRSVRADLRKGAVWASVKRLEPGETFAVTGPALAVALGPATFRVELQDSGAVTVSVYDGEVRVQYPPGETERPCIYNLSKNQGLKLSPGVSPSPAPLPQTDPWRRGWRVQTTDEPDSIPDPPRRIEEKPHPRATPARPLPPADTRH